MTELQDLLSKEVNGLEVVIVKVPTRLINAEKLKEITQRVSSAVRIGINLA
jgi:2-succinyl-5-enolpyruvyl-6-hydroxy-3-cyclohexene-1-carboxylate synthase